jgi:hypothetical protein
MTEQEWNDLKDRELDKALSSLFASVEKPKPQPGFAAQTMTAVRAVDLPPGRVRLRHPFLVPAAWILIFCGVSAAAYRLAMTQPAVLELLASFVTLGIRAGFWLLHATRETLAFSGPLAAASRALARVVVTTEGSLALLLVAALGGMSFSMLHRLLTTPVASASKLEERF